MPADLTDDQTDAIAERVADDVTSRILREHPASSPAFRKLLVRLYVRQAIGTEEPPGRITGAALAAHLGLAPQRLSEIQSTALARAYHTYHTRFPELL